MSVRSEQLRLRDGRLLGYAIYGDVQGRPVLMFHGFPGSHQQAALVQEQATKAGVPLIAFDRPGFGDSSPAPKAQVGDVIADATELVDHLGHRRFATLGISCGGPYALAAARLLPERVSGVGLLAGIAPMDRPEIRRDQHPMLKLMFGLARIQPWLISPLLLLDRMMFRRDAEAAVKALAGMLTPPDRELVERDALVRQRFGISLARAYAQGIAGSLGEAGRIARLRSDSLDGIQAPVHIFQGGQDRNVPPAMGAYLAQRLPQGRLHDYPEDGHLSIVTNRFAECIARLHPKDSPAANAPQL